MTEQTKAIFENPQLLREKLGEFFDTQNEKTIEKYAVVGEKMFEKGNRQKLKMYFNEWGAGVWVATISFLAVILSLILSLFVDVSYQIIYGAIAIFWLTVLGHFFVLSYRGYMNNIIEFVIPFIWLFILLIGMVFVALIFEEFVRSAGIAWAIVGLVALSIFSLFGFRYLFVKELVMKHIAKLLDNVVKNTECKQISKFVFGSDYEFKKGGGKKLFKTIFMGIFSLIVLCAAAAKEAVKEIKKIERNHIAIEEQIEIAPKQSKADENTMKIAQKPQKVAQQVNSIENAKKLLDSGNEGQARQILSELCEKNNAEACHELGLNYEIEDKIKAITFKQKACELGLAQSCFEVGKFYDDNKNGENTLKYYKKACDSDNAPACRELSWIYDKGQYVKRNEIEAITLLNKALRLYEPSCYKEGGFKICQYLAEQYENKKDWKNAIKFYDLACNGGLPVACKIIAEKYEKGLVIQQNLEQAKEYYGKYCDLGFEDGCKEYKRLNNTNSNKSVDQNELANQCDKNNALSCRNLGLMYEDGILNVGNEKQTQIQALKIFDKACNLGDAKSCEHAWWMYSKINVKCEPECIFTPKDDELYSKYMDRACELDINFCTAE